MIVSQCLQSAEGLIDYRLARGPAPASPASERLQAENVVAHALRHLVHLLHSDPVVAAAFAETPAVV
ncbi:hypothetical protein [Streptosporangium sp. NPDC051022]|uniref:hypothetical protein n=1 Tax=Streptosporangium sp. NPDC051022 TaxID=3155752 RepID=UPI00342B305D